ncbi:unnamed protein product [Heligmosomoides polygyrus]|uniref:BAG domain-containing protein n=1 Tax=Heligmosomoides polygyrus TaxID=6339 RepID=A0A183FMY1_HELPZ|nr:unnamed protein product [Heligmosomoides polygyrus]
MSGAVQEISTWINATSSPEGEDFSIQRRRLRSAKISLEVNVRYVENALAKYLDAVDNLDVEAPEEIQKRVSLNVEKAEDIVHQAQDLLITVEQRSDELKEQEKNQPNAAPGTTLAPIPIPKFGGWIWEWKSFWEAFSHKVHSKDITTKQSLRNESPTQRIGGRSQGFNPTIRDFEQDIFTDHRTPTPEIWREGSTPRRTPEKTA